MTAPHPVFTLVVEADGALLWFDLRELLAAPGAVVRIEVVDAAAAGRWLVRLAGPERARAAIVDGSVEFAAPAELAHLALVLWARRWWPAGPSAGVPALDHAVLALEAAVATAAVDELADGVLDGFEATPAELFDVAAPALLARPQPAAATLCDRLAHWFDDQDDIQRADAAARLARVSTGAAPTQRAYALAAGPLPATAGDGVLAGGLSSVDWALVPPGILDAGEDTVRWQVVAAADGTRVIVAVGGALGDAALTATLTIAGTPLTTVSLTKVDDRYLGTRALDEPGTRAVATNPDQTAIVVSAAGVRVADAGPRTTAADRATVTALVRSRATLPPAARTLAERIADQGLDEF